MTPSIRPMLLGDIFDRLFRLIGRTIGRNSILVLILLLPLALVFITGLHYFFSSLADLIQKSSTDPNGPFSQNLPQILLALAAFLVGYFSLAVGIAAAHSAVTFVGCSEMDEQSIAWEDALGLIFPSRFLRVCGQIMLQAVCLVGLFCVPVLSVLLIRVSGWFGLLAFIAFPLWIFFTVKLVVDWAFTTPVIVWEEAGILDSFGRSSELVKGQWWRIFGILLLLSLIVQFAISIITTPINLIALWGFYSKYFLMIGSLKKGNSDPREGAEMLRSLGLGMGLVTSVAQILSSTVLPLVTTVLYFDLRARKGEFVEPALPGSAGSVAGVPS